MIERFRNVLIRATVGGLAFSAIAVSGATAEEAKGQAQAEFVKRGTLSCDIAAGIGLVVGSSKALTCVFEADGQKSPYKYSGTIDKLGLDIGVTAESRVVWSVYAKPKPSSRALLPATIPAFPPNSQPDSGWARNPWSARKRKSRCSR